MQLVDRYRPRRLDDFVGISRAKAILGHFAAAPYAASWLLCGPPGVGKTSLGFALSDMIGGEKHHIPSKDCNLETVDRVCHMCHYTPWKGRFHVVITDETDEMSKPAQTAFLSRLDGTATPGDTIWLFTANDTKKLEKRFLSRCRKIEFPAPMAGEISAFLATIWAKERPGVEAPDLASIAREADGNVRSALMLLETELLLTPTATPVPRPAPRLELRKPKWVFGDLVTAGRAA